MIVLHQNNQSDWMPARGCQLNFKIQFSFVDKIEVGGACTFHFGEKIKPEQTIPFQIIFPEPNVQVCVARKDASRLHETPKLLYEISAVKISLYTQVAGVCLPIQTGRDVCYIKMLEIIRAFSIVSVESS